MTRNIDYSTPQWLFDALDAEFHFTIDACGLPHNAKCPRYWSPEQDGLRQDWLGEVPWWNPPYDDLGAWARKAYNESLRGVTSVGLVPMWRKEHWFKLCVENAQMRMIQGGRMFFAGGGEQQGLVAHLDCCVFCFGPGFQGNTIGPFLVPPYKKQSPPQMSGVRTYVAELEKPPGTKVLRKYSELVPYIDEFGLGKFDLLAIIGHPGLAKSSLLCSHLPAKKLWVGGNASPFKVYCRAFKSLNLPIIFEDAGNFLRTPAGISLLQELTEHEGEKNPCWDTDSGRLKKLKIPNRYTTESKVCLVTNRWGTLATALNALEDRAIVVAHEPSAAEVHSQVLREGWFHDDDILNFVEANLWMNLAPSMRHYTKAVQVKNAGMDWRDYLRNLWLTDEALVRVAMLLDDESLATTRAKAAAFVARGWGSRAYFFRKAKILREASAPPTSVVSKSTVFQNMPQ